jgi:hypothetical protein
MNLVEIAVFTFPNEAAVLESILQSKDIKYAVMDAESALIVPGSGVTIFVLDKEFDRAVEIIREAGFEDHLIPRN